MSQEAYLQGFIKRARSFGLNDEQIKEAGTKTWGQPGYSPADSHKGFNSGGFSGVGGSSADFYGDNGVAWGANNLKEQGRPTIKGINNRGDLVANTPPSAAPQQQVAQTVPSDYQAPTPSQKSVNWSYKPSSGSINSGVPMRQSTEWNTPGMQPITTPNPTVTAPITTKPTASNIRRRPMASPMPMTALASVVEKYALDGWDMQQRKIDEGTEYNPQAIRESGGRLNDPYMDTKDGVITSKYGPSIDPNNPNETYAQAQQRQPANSAAMRTPYDDAQYALNKKMDPNYAGTQTENGITQPLISQERQKELMAQNGWKQGEGFGPQTGGIPGTGKGHFNEAMYNNDVKNERAGLQLASQGATPKIESPSINETFANRGTQPTPDFDIASNAPKINTSTGSLAFHQPNFNTSLQPNKPVAPIFPNNNTMGSPGTLAGVSPVSVPNASHMAPQTQPNMIAGRRKGLPKQSSVQYFKSFIKRAVDAGYAEDTAVALFEKIHEV